MTKDFLKDMIKYLPAQIAPGIVGFISIPIITRIFLPQDYGNFNLVIATVMVLTTLFGWLPMSIIRFYQAYERDKKLDSFFGNIIKFALISILAITLLFIFFLLIIRTYMSSRFYSLISIGIGVFIVMAIFSIFQQFLRAKRRVSLYTGFAIWRSIMGFGIGLGLIVLFKIGIEGLLLGIILSIVIILPLLWRKAIGNASIIFSDVNLSLIKEMAKYSFPLVIGQLAAWILSLSDRYILELFRGSQDVGIYSASYNISEKSIMLLVTLFMLASTPISIHIWEKEGENKSKDFLNKVTRYYLMLCLPAGVVLCVLSKPIIKIMTGAQYYEGYKILPFVSLGVFFLGLQKRFNDGLLLRKKTNLIALAIVISGFLNLFLNFLFIPKYGYFGAAVTTLISYTFLLFLMIVFSRKFIVWKFPIKSLAKVICASASMGLVVYYIGNSLTSSVFLNLISSICIGVLVYFLMLLLLREFSQEELQLFYKLKNKILS